MKPSIKKLHNYFELEASRGFDNRAIMGGLERMLGPWEAEARGDALDEDLIQAVVSRIRDYPRLSVSSRREMLEGLWRRVQRQEGSPTINFGQHAPDQVTKKKIETKKTAKEASPEKISSDAILSTIEESAEEIKTEQPGTSDIDADGEERRKATEAVPTEPVALDASVQILPGIGPSYAKTLNHIGIFTLRDMLYYFPRRYDDYSLLKPINRLEAGEELTVIGTIQRVTSRKLQSGKTQLVEALLNDGTGTLRINWFNQRWVARRLHKDAQIVASGKVDRYLGRLVMNNPEWEFLDKKQITTNRIVPVYPLTAKLTQRRLRKIMNQVVSYWALRVNDPLPEQLRQSAGVVDLSRALSQIHFPDTWEDLKAARYRLAFDEILLMQLGVLGQKRAWQQRTARRFIVDDAWMERQLARLPYSLTQAQQRAIEDMRYDLASGHPMNRLLQGDVGSGKTVVAAFAVGMVVKNGAQAAFMAPTGILAEQHYRNLIELLATGEDKVLDASQIRLLVGATPEAEKREIREALVEGSIKLLIGTHAVIEDPIKFTNLQLVVVDEQHRFGVRQRAALRAKGNNPHLIVMTATPIPRSLALTIYGDLDISVMDEMPSGRKMVKTYLVMPRELERAYSLIRSEVSKGRQAFIVYPLVEESETSQAKAAVEQYEYLQNEIFPSLRLGLLHGRMTADDKEKVMAGLRDGVFDILISTTVIEVGLDLPNASVILIEGANRFGLAQLHQLRGRVGRGTHESYCLLVPEKPDDADNERLKAMVETNDGFVLAERDLEQRGPGEFLGTRQAGFAELKMADLADVRLIENAREHAKILFEIDPNLSQPQLRHLASAMQYFWDNGKGDIS
jgi:ATP-dependent DNA helicase RecG